MRPTVARKKLDNWTLLARYIRAHTQAAIDNSRSGGGDPADVELLETRFKLAWLELQSHIEKMRREFE